MVTLMKAHLHYITVLCAITIVTPCMASRAIGGGYLSRGPYAEPDWRPILTVFLELLAVLLVIQAGVLLHDRRNRRTR